VSLSLDRRLNARNRKSFYREIKVGCGDEVGCTVLGRAVRAHHQSLSISSLLNRLRRQNYLDEFHPSQRPANFLFQAGKELMDFDGYGPFIVASSSQEPG
jgi:hypothetical protein